MECPRWIGASSQAPPLPGATVAAKTATLRFRGFGDESDSERGVKRASVGVVGRLFACPRGVGCLVLTSAELDALARLKHLRPGWPSIAKNYPLIVIDPIAMPDHQDALRRLGAHAFYSDPEITILQLPQPN